MAAQFSSDSKYFAQLSNEGKLKVWNAVSGKFEQEYTPDFHLTCPCTCLQFVAQRQPKQGGSPRKKRRNSWQPSAPHIVLGTSSGALLVYSVALGDLACKVDSDTNQSIACLSASQGDCLYSGADRDILCWDLVNKSLKDKWKAGNDKVTALLVIPKGRLLSASKNIKMWDVDAKKVLRTFTGHSSDVSLLKYVQPKDNSDSYCLSGSKGDRLLSCWNLSENTDGRSAIASFLMEDVVSNISVVNGEDGSTNMAAVTRSGVVHVYAHTLNGNCVKPLKPKTTIQIASDTGQNKSVVKLIPIAGAILRKDFSLTICYGSAIMLTFENIVLSNLERTHCLVRSDSKSPISKHPDHFQDKKPRTENNVQYLTPHVPASVPTKRKVGEQQEVPMERRLENLTLNKLDGDSKVPRSDNVAQLLLQGLHSKDKNILKSVLSRREEPVIRNTIKRLPMPVIVPLVHELAGYVQGKTILSHTGALWLKHLLQVHSGLLLSNPELSELLTPLLGSIESRLSLQVPLSRLRGRLDLLISQVNVNKNDGCNEDDAPLLTYVDKDSSDSEMDGLEIAHSESENDWMEDDSDGDDDPKDSDSVMST